VARQLHALVFSAGQRLRPVFDEASQSHPVFRFSAEADALRRAV